MAPRIMPQAGVRYRIQNVDWGTYLERHDKNHLEMRPEKNNEKQQWLFNKDSSDTYEIQNVHDRHAYLIGTIGPKGGTLGSKKSLTSSAPQRWRLGLGPNRTMFMVNASLGDGESSVAYVQTLQNSANPSIVEDTDIESIDEINKGEEYQWRLIEVTPASLQDGDGEYRIRTLNAEAIYADGSNLKVSAPSAQDKGLPLAWKITSLGNGKCTIQHVKDKSFLVTERVNGEWVPRLSKTSSEVWIINLLSVYTYSIFIEKSVTQDAMTFDNPLSLSIKDKSVVLKPVKTAHSQIWMIELADATLNVQKPGQKPGPAEIVSGLKAGEYALRNLGSNNTVYFQADLSRDTFTLLGSRTGDRNEFRVELVPQGEDGEVYIYYKGSRWTKYFTFRNSTLVGENNPFPLIVENGPSANQYYICNKANPQEVLSAPDNGNVFSTKPKTNELRNLWSFDF